MDPFKTILSQLDLDAKKALFGLLYWEIHEKQESEPVQIEQQFVDGWPLHACNYPQISNRDFYYTYYSFFVMIKITVYHL